MKLKTTIKKSLLIIAMFIVLITPTFAGCFSVDSMKLSTPEIALHEESKCITWEWIKNSKRYEVYCNDELLDTVPSSVLQKSYVYEFTDSLTEIKDYKFYIIAVANSSINEDSDASNSVTYTCSSLPEVINPGDRDNSVNTNSPSDNVMAVAVNGTRLDISLMPDDNIQGYDLYLWSNSTGLNVYPIDVEATKHPTYNSCSVNLLNATYNLQDEIYAIRVGYVMNDKHYINSEVKYFNPDSKYQFYSDDIFIFDGLIHDMYLESIEELRHVVYYTFINRDSEVSIKLSSSLKTVINAYSGYNGGSTFDDKMISALMESYNYFMETRDAYSFKLVKLSSDNSEYSLQISYDDDIYLNSEGKPEPEISFKPKAYVYDEIEWDTFYDECGYTMRADDEKYDGEGNEYKFASDSQFLYTNVSSSEQLYWAVENKVTPVCEKGSRAEIIYNKAKNVLNNIISDEMTDYEKALSIYDWINKNTVYDYYALTSEAYGIVSVQDKQGTNISHISKWNGYKLAVNSATLLPAYYLEGVFMTGYAVCDGFSKAFSLMCNMEGIDTIRIVGTVDGEGHAWNKVGIDFDPTDNEGAKYYIVDITWTEMKGSSYYKNEYYCDRMWYYYKQDLYSKYVSADPEEVTSHEYFMVDDEYIASTHTPFAKRSKFSRYAINRERYNYYNNTTFTFSPTSYGAMMNDETKTTFDLIIESEDDLTAMFYYMMVENKDSIEVVFDFNFIAQVDIDAGGTGKMTDAYGNFRDEMLKPLVALMKSKKFLSQYLFLNHNYYPTFVYNEEGDYGLLMVLENNICIDEVNEVGHLIEFLDHYDVYGTYELYIKGDILDKVSGADELSKAITLFASAVNSHDVNVTISLIATSDQSTEDQAYYSLKISQKS